MPGVEYYVGQFSGSLLLVASQASAERDALKEEVGQLTKQVADLRKQIEDAKPTV